MRRYSELQNSGTRDKMKQFKFSLKPACPTRQALKEGVLPLGWILLITAGLVALFAAFISAGHGMEPMVPLHMDDGEEVDPSPMRFAFMCIAFVAAFVFAWAATKAGRKGKTMAAFLLGYTAGTLLWQSIGECAWHFSITAEDYLMCFPHIEGASSLFFVIIFIISIIYCYKRNAFDWGVWVSVLSFAGNWLGHFVLIGTYPLVHTLLSEAAWFRGAGAAIGIPAVLFSLYLNFFAARSKKARLCCCLALYFSLGVIVTGVAGI